MTDISDPAFQTFFLGFQRDLNRILEQDKNTRKRGLQNLLDTLPWDKKKTREHLSAFVSNHLLERIIITLCDTVEKCRELSLKIIQKSLELQLMSPTSNHEKLLLTLCARVAEIPYPEITEELRYLVTDIIQSLLKPPFICSYSVPVLENVIKSFSKALKDNFSNVKRGVAENITLLATNRPEVIQMAYKPLIDPLVANGSHQHSKTRMCTLKAASSCLACLKSEDYETSMQNSIHQFFSRVLADGNVGARKELASVIQHILVTRLRSLGILNLLEVDIRLISYVLVLMADESEEVQTCSRLSLASITTAWMVSAARSNERQNNGITTTPLEFDANAHIVDGELELQQVSVDTDRTDVETNIMAVDISQSQPNLPNDTTLSNDVHATENSNLPAQCLVVDTLPRLVPLLVEGMGSWTLDARCRYLRGTTMMIKLASVQISSHLPDLLVSLFQSVADSESLVRLCAEQCCRELGQHSVVADLLSLLLPRARGELSGSNTASQRTCSLLLLTHCLAGHANSNSYHNNSTPPVHPTRSSHLSPPLSNQVCVTDSENSFIVSSVASLLRSPSLHEHREASVREAVLLLIRTLLTAYSYAISDTAVQRAVWYSLLHVQVRCGGSGSSRERDAVIQDTAQREIKKLAELSCAQPSSNNEEYLEISLQIEKQMSVHFEDLCLSILDSTCTRSAPSSTRWSSDSVAKGAFDALVRLTTKHAWVHHKLVFEIICPQVQPQRQPDTDTPEAHMQSYAAQRGEETVPSLSHIDVRLSLLVLTETMVREASSNWECGRFLADSATNILQNIITPNLVWRVGRVESTMRKVSMAICYAMLKAGAVSQDILFQSAAQLVPLIVSHLDDTDVTPRLLSCLCLRILFERLNGAFSEQAVNEIYPKLLKRLDDSNDEVRATICSSIAAFFRCSPRSYYHATLLDYTLDQLFLHLDDIESSIQEVVLDTIISMKDLDKELILKKAELNRSTHRTTQLCDRIEKELLGYEIIDSTDS